MERDVKIAGGVSSDLCGEAGICPGEFLSVGFPPTPQFCAFVAHILLSRKGGAAESCLKNTAPKGWGEKRANSF